MDCRDEFHKNLLLNDTVDTSEDFINECQEIVKSIGNLDYSSLNLKILYEFFCELDFLHDHNINRKIEYIKTLYTAINGKEIEAKELKGCLDAFKLFNNVQKYTQNENMIKFMITDFKDYLDIIIDPCTRCLYPDDEYNKEYFKECRLPIIRIMKYCLKNNLFEIYFQITRKIEPRIINIFFDTYSEEIVKIINRNQNNSYVLLLFTGLDENNLNRFFTDNLFILLENANCFLIDSLINNEIPKSYIINNYFTKAFKKFNLGSQTSILNTLSDFEYPNEFIFDLHKLLNKPTKNDSKIRSTLGITDSYFQWVYYRISNSSYFMKYNVEESELWKVMEKIYNNEEFKVNKNLNLYEYLMNLYDTCYKYATESIVNSLYPLDNLKNEITYLKNVKFNILAVGNNAYGCDHEYCAETVDALFCDNQNFACGHILTENNFSHASDAHRFFGFYTNITTSSIVKMECGEMHLPNLKAKYVQSISKNGDLLLGIDDLNKFALNMDTFSTICFRTKTNNNQPIKPNCIICFDEVNKEDLECAKKFNQKILVLKRNPYTIENNEIDDYRGQGEVSI